MVRYESFCVECEHCIGQGCRNAKPIPVYYCDECGDECGDDVYDVNGDELCDYCLRKKFRREWC